MPTTASASRRPAVELPGAPRPADRGPGLRDTLLAAAIYLTATLLCILPFMGDPRGTLGPDLGDPRLNLYLLQWGAHEIERGLDGFWNAPFFHPTPAVLTISDHLLGPAAQAWLLERFGAAPATAYNLLLLASFALGGLTTWWLLRRAGLGFAGALLGGALYAFGHGRWYEASHLQVLISQWIPAALLAWDQLLDRPGWRRLLVFLAFYALQVTAGVYLAVLLHFGLAALTWARRGSLASRDGWLRRRPAPLLAAVVLGAALFVPLALPYATRDPALGAPNPRLELRRYGATLASFVTPSRFAPLEQLGIFPSPDRGALFLGFAASGLALAGLAARIRRPTAPIRWSPRDVAAVTVAALALAGGLALADLSTLERLPRILPRGTSWLGYHVALALVGAGAYGGWRVLRRVRGGPLLRTWETPLRRGVMAVGVCGLLLTLPMTLALLQELAPPLAALRVSHRSFVLAVPAIGLLAGSALDGWLARRRRGPGRALAVGLLFAVVGLELSPRLPPWHPVPSRASDFPAYLSVLRDTPDVKGYVEIPFTPGWRETERMLLQTWNWKPLVNGYSAVIAPSYDEISSLFDPMPDDAGLDRLLALGVSHLVVHHEAERPTLRRASRRWVDRAIAARRIVRVREIAPVAIYRILPRRGGSSPP